MRCTMSYARLALLMTASTLAACAASAPDATNAPENAPAVGLANPASVHCIERGGRLEIRQGAEGNESGWCHLPDGRVVEEWALFRAEVLGENQP